MQRVDGLPLISNIKSMFMFCYCCCCWNPLSTKISKIIVIIVSYYGWLVTNPGIKHEVWHVRPPVSRDWTELVSAKGHFSFYKQQWGSTGLLDYLQAKTLNPSPTWLPLGFAHFTIPCIYLALITTLLITVSKTFSQSILDKLTRGILDFLKARN